MTTLLKSSPPLGADLTKRSTRDLLRQTARIDFFGATLVAAAVTCLVLALQWGGNTKPWGDKAVIITFVFAAVTTVAFIGWEKFLGDKAMTPLKIFKSRSVYVSHSINIFSAYANEFRCLDTPLSSTASSLVSRSSSSPMLVIFPALLITFFADLFHSIFQSSTKPSSTTLPLRLALISSPSCSASS